MVYTLGEEKVKCFSQLLSFDLSKVKSHSKGRHILKNKCTLIQMSLGTEEWGTKLPSDCV